MMVNCDTCGKEFYKKPSRIKKTNHNYCSRACTGEGHKKLAKKGKIIKCYECKKEVYKFKSKLDSSNKNYCSIECARIGIGKRRRGENHPMWKNGISTYRELAFSIYENKCVSCNYNEYIEILEVHHIDENRENNNINNLEILCPNCHAIKHL